MSRIPRTHEMIPWEISQMQAPNHEHVFLNGGQIKPNPSPTTEDQKDSPAHQCQSCERQIVTDSEGRHLYVVHLLIATVVHYAAVSSLVDRWAECW